MRTPKPDTVAVVGQQIQPFGQAGPGLAPLKQLGLQFDMASSTSPTINRLLQSLPTRKRWVAPDTAGLWRSSHDFDENITDASPWLRPQVP